jgi:hypothetical protein
MDLSATSTNGREGAAAAMDSVYGTVIVFVCLLGAAGVIDSV